MSTAAQNTLKDQIEALQSLISHPGWEYMCGRITAQCEAQMSAMRNAPTQEALLKATYTYLALQDLTKAPQMLLGVMAKQLQTTAK